MSVIRNILGNKIYYRPQGFLDAQNASEIITPLDISTMEKRGIKCVMIDFSKIISANMNALRFLNDVSEHLYKKGVQIAFCCANDYTYNIINKLDNVYFSYFESEEVFRIFCEEDYIPSNQVILCCIKDEQNKNMLLFHLVKKGITPAILDNESEIGEGAIVIKKSFISKISNKVIAIMKNGVIYFFFDGFLDANISNMFDIEYFRRNLLIGFKIFAFDMNNVKGLNVHAVRFLSKLGVESAEFGALLAIIGLDKRNVQPKLIEDLEDVGFLFFKNEEEFISSKAFKEAYESSGAVYRKKRKITKDFVKILPYFVNATITTIELMTGVKSKKEPPAIKEVNIDTSRKDLVASSIGFYGDLDGALILIFTEKLSKRISKILIGEEYKTREEMVDLVSEFANIIVGNVKLELSKQDIDINLTLPKVFDNLEELHEIVINRQGIEVKFYFEEEEFYFYLIR